MKERHFFIDYAGGRWLTESQIVDAAIDLLGDLIMCPCCYGRGWNYNDYPDNIDDSTEYTCVLCNGTGKTARVHSSNR